MKISTTHKGVTLTGVVIAHAPYFLEVAITSPVSKLITSRSIPTFARAHRRFEGQGLEQACCELLIELYEIVQPKTVEMLESGSGFGKSNNVEVGIGHHPE
jgi:hypothetical protein